LGFGAETDTAKDDCFPICSRRKWDKKKYGKFCVMSGCVLCFQKDHRQPLSWYFSSRSTDLLVVGRHFLVKPGIIYYNSSLLR